MSWEKILKGDNLPKGPHQNDDVPEEAFEKVMIDPDFEYPDVDAKNNYWYPSSE